MCRTTYSNSTIMAAINLPCDLACIAKVGEAKNVSKLRSNIQLYFTLN